MLGKTFLKTFEACHLFFNLIAFIIHGSKQTFDAFSLVLTSFLNSISFNTNLFHLKVLFAQMLKRFSDTVYFVDYDLILTQFLFGIALLKIFKRGNFPLQTHPLI